ncbi:MAG TPA: nuclear transport factor 2 family protein [Solirubrobacteraceae bacterium]|nr:nuclear transport factor 2 family protein [Solirubrobacteraceae bacterium]
MEEEHPNVRLIREAYAATREMDDAGSGRDDDTPRGLFGLMNEDVRVHHGGRGPFAGTHDGRNAIRATMMRALELSADTFDEFAPHILVGDDDFVYASQRATARGDDGVIETTIVAVYQLREGRIVEIWQHIADQDEWDAFWNRLAFRR